MTRTNKLKALAVEYQIAIRESIEECVLSSEEDLLEYLDGTRPIEQWVAVTHNCGSEAYYLRTFPTREQAEAHTIEYDHDDIFTETPVAVVDLDGEGEQWGKRYPLVELQPVFASPPKQDEPHYGMYTPEGNARVHAIVQEILSTGNGKSLEDLHDEAVCELGNLVREVGFNEALDTAVRDAVFVALSEGGEES